VLTLQDHPESLYWFHRALVGLDAERRANAPKDKPGKGRKSI
jgi:hypothetical protein